MRRLRWLALGLGGLVLGALAVLARWRSRDDRAPILAGWPRVVVVGAGFGGLRAARRLAGAPAEVLVVDQHNYHLFQPLLYQVATAGIEPEEIAHPVRRILSRFPNVRFQMAKVTGVKLAERRLVTDVGEIPYDYLVLAAGSTTNYFGREDLARRSHGLKNLDQAVELRNHILTMFERAVAETDPARRAAMLTFVVVGGGPTGVEFAGALAELIRLVLVRDYPALDLSVVRVVLVEATDRVLPMLPESLQHAAVAALKAKGVEVRLGAAVAESGDGFVRFADGSEMAAHTLIWAAGVRAVDLAAALGVELGRGGRVRVEPTLQLPGHPEVYVVGDMAYLEQDGAPLPMVAPVAIQQGEHAATNIRRQLQGLEPLPFRYRDPGTMATIGRNAAVAYLHGLSVTGFPAWVLWLVVHLIQLVGFRNRLLVLINWAWDYFFYDRAVRLITRE